MNSVSTSVLLLALAVAFVAPLTQGSKQETEHDRSAIVDGAKLVMTLKSDDFIVRTPRGSDMTAALPATADSAATVENVAAKHGNNAGLTGGDKRSKNGGGGGHNNNNNNKKLNRNKDFNTPIGGRKSHMDKNPLNNGEQQQHHQHTGGKRQQFGNRQQHGSLKGNKQRQFLKSQQHQGHQGGGKRNEQKLNAENGENGAATDVTKTQSTCRYSKSAWSDCDPKTNTHSRTLTLKKGDSNCLQTRTIQKKCKKACRYEKGTWSECKNGQMTRIDKLKATSSFSSSSSTTTAAEASCEAARTVNRKCNPEGSKPTKTQQNGNGNGKAKKERKSKDKGANRGGTQQA